VSRHLGIRLLVSVLLLGLLASSVGAQPPPVAAQEPFDRSTVTEIPAAERQALVTLYNATGGHSWTNNEGWLGTDSPCEWYGVVCDWDQDSDSLRVYALDLSDNNLVGPLPDAIGDLGWLSGLTLSNNQLSSLPTTIGQLNRLSILVMNNNLVEAVPDQIGNLNLVELDLGSNQLSGLPTTVGQIDVLRWLYVGNNLLTTLPDVFDALGNLMIADFSHNMLTNLPESLGRRKSLEFLYLEGNQLTMLPSSFGNLEALSQLYLHDNPLSGPMPDMLADLTNLGLGGWPPSPFTFYNTDWCVPSTGPVPAWLAGIEHQGTGMICGQDPGAISGSVTLSDMSPLAGIQVQLYRQIHLDRVSVGEEFRGAVMTAQSSTEADGSYQFGGLGQGIDYRVHFVDPTGQNRPEYYDGAYLLEDSTPVTITLGTVRSGIDAVLDVPLPPASETDPGTGTVTYSPDGLAHVQQVLGERSNITITLPVTCPGGETPSDVQLLLVASSSTVTSTYPMTETEPGLYTGIIPADDVESSTLDVSYTCNSTPAQKTVGTITLYDPSGIITDADSGEPVVGAKVTLYHVPDWSPRTGPADTRPNTCESNKSKAADAPWSQPAPVNEGIIANAENPPIAPAISHQVTDADGRYGWDVAEGCWYVQVEAEGYGTLVSPVVGVPPEVTDLDLALTSPRYVYLPLVLR
jgi:hypothetical protein